MRWPIAVERVQHERELMLALAIREAVFIVEQQMTEDDEDAFDRVAFHVLARERERAVGTGRLVVLEAVLGGPTGCWGRIGRMAVLREHRGKGVGGRILAALEEEARRREAEGVLLHAEVSARGFYERAGYEAAGGVFDEGGLPCLEMRKLSASGS